MFRLFLLSEVLLLFLSLVVYRMFAGLLLRRIFVVFVLRFGRRVHELVFLVVLSLDSVPLLCRVVQCGLRVFLGIRAIENRVRFRFLVFLICPSF